MPTDSQIAPLSMANTKQQMLEAYQQAKRLLAEHQQSIIDAERERDRFRDEAAVGAAERAAAEDPVRRIQDLKACIGRDLTSVAEKFEAAVRDYEGLEEAVARKRAEIERIYGVESAAADLAALLEAHARRKTSFDAEIAAARAAWQEEQRRHLGAVEAERSALTQERDRERESYDYHLARERERRRQELEDELAEIGREIAGRRQEAAHEFAEREAALARREELLAEREKRVEELERIVAGMPDRLAAETKRATEEVTERLGAGHASEVALLRKEHEGERNVLSSRIEALERLVEQQSLQVRTLAAQQERAYAQLQDIATRAVEGAQRHGATALAASQPPRLPAEGA